MDILVLSMAALAALAPSPPPTPSAGASTSNHVLASSARRSQGGSVATATISVRIIRQSARVGAGLEPPLPGMTPRPATIAAADGRQVDALIYDFE